MKILGRKSVRTCLGMLLIVTCFLTSFLFLNIDSNAIERIEIDPKSGVGVVRFTSPDGLVSFKEADTGREGYFHWRYAGDAAYIGMSNVGGTEVVVCKVAGVVMKVDKQYVSQIVSYQNQKISYYSVADNGYLMHTYTYYTGSSLAQRSLRVGYKPSYLSAGSIYYSYDGHYFYTEFEKMISDYRNNTYSNAVNANAPYYNYYQYLSLHTTATPTAEQYDAHVAANKEKSLMLTTGNAFVSTQNKHTMNALLMYGLAINESNWGTSDIAYAKNNLFGLKAVDSNPGASAEAFASVEECIEKLAYSWLHKGYMNGGDSRYRGPHLGDKHSGFNVKYASDPYWGEKAAERGYLLEAAQSDYGRYSIGITRGVIKFYKEADTSSAVIYTSDTATGGTIHDFPVTILEKVSGANGELFYRAVSDMALKTDRSGRDEGYKPKSEREVAVYDSNRDYVYVSANDVQIVFESGTSIPLPDSPQQETPTKTQEEVLQALELNNTDNCLSGFAVGSDVNVAIAKAREFDSNVQISVKRADGTEVVEGTVATGMRISITTGGTTIDYSVVIRGDVNGDGKMSALDYVIVRKYMDNESTLEGAYCKGADTNGDGNVSALDYVILRNHMDNKSTIVQ